LVVQGRLRAAVKISIFGTRTSWSTKLVT